MQIGKGMASSERLNSIDTINESKSQNSLVFKRLFFGALTGCLMAFFFADSPLLENLELSVLKWQYKIADTVSAFSKTKSTVKTAEISKDVAIVAFDDASQFDLGIPRFNFSQAQETLAKVINTVEGGKPLIVAIDLDIRGSAQNDLAKIFTRYHNVILSVFGSLEGNSDLPAAEFLTHAISYGYHDLIKESNGSIYRLPLSISNRQETNTLSQVPSLVEAIMMAYRAQKGVNKPSQLQLLKPDQLAYINFQKLNYPTYSMATLLDPSFDPSVFKGRIVLIGSTLTARKQDLSHTHTPLKSYAPEIFIQADALTTLINNNAIYSYPKSIAHHIMILIGSIFGALFSILSSGKRFTCLIVAAIALALSAQIAFQVFYTLIPVVSITAMIISGFVLGTVIFLDTDLQQRNKELALAHQSMQVRAEEERKRIAEDLHDETLPALSSVARMIDELADNNSENVVAYKMRSKLDNTIQEMRRVINDLHPSVLETMGFVPALENLLNILTKELDITSKFENKSENDTYEIPDFMKLQLYRIVQEALNNVAKHSGAKHVELSIEKQNGQIEIAVADNGKGMSEATRLDSHGLLNIKHRAQLIGANIAWRQAEQFSSGCLFKLSLPLKNNEENK
jgi:signal transduction histidine kinase